MKQMKPVLAVAIAALLISGCQKQESGGIERATTVPETEKQKYSYAIGQNMGGGLKASQIEIDPSFFTAGFFDAADGEQRMTQEEMQAALTTLQQKAQETQMVERKKQMETQLALSDDFLAKNKGEEGVTTTDSGLQYKVVTTGEGAKPSATDTVSVHYEGRLIDGKVFDSSLERGQPVEFPVNGVIAGWTEALQLMPAGSKWQLTIPPNLAYGETGAGNMIGPNSVLIFDVELLSIVQSADAAASE